MDTSENLPDSPRDNKRYDSGSDSRLFMGLILVATGAVLIAKNLNLLSYEMSHILISWPMLIVAIGLFNLARRAYTPGYILVAIGLIFLVPRILVVENFYRNFWPAVLIAIGIIFIFQKKRNPYQNNYIHTGRSSKDYIDETAILGGRNVSIVSDNFKGGRITSILGGSNINLLYSKPAPGCIIDVSTILGGTKLIVPEDWNIKVEVSAIAGGFEDRRSAAVISRADPDKTVIIKGSCIFGGGEITSIP